MVNFRLVQFLRVIQSFCKYFISSVSYRNTSEIIFHLRPRGFLSVFVRLCPNHGWFSSADDAGMVGVELYKTARCWKIKEQSETSATQWAWMMSLSDRHTITSTPLTHSHLHHHPPHITASSPPPASQPRPQTPGWSALFVLLTTTLMTCSKVLRQPKVGIKTDLILCPFH